MQFVDILFYIIIVCDLVLVIFRLQSVLSAFHILLTICFLHCKSTHHALCTAVGFSQSSAMIEWVQGESSGQKIANSTSNGQNHRDLIEWIGVIHLQVCIFGLLKNCNDLGVSKSSHFLCRITLVSLPASRKLQCTERVAFMQPVSQPELSAQTSVMDRYRLPAAHKGHHFCKNFTKYSVPSLSLGWNMIFNMLHKMLMTFLGMKLKVTQNRRRKGRVCRMLPPTIPFMYYRTSHGLSQIPTTWGNFAHAHIVITN